MARGLCLALEGQTEFLQEVNVVGFVVSAARVLREEREGGVKGWAGERMRKGGKEREWKG